MDSYLNYLKKLKTVCAKKEYTLSEIGQANTLPLYKITINPIALKTIVFSAGIHGDEVAGHSAILEFCKQFNPANYPRLKIIIFPVANPTGFETKSRRNYLHKDLNRLFCNKKLTGENKALMDALKQENILFFHALHEDLDADSFYSYIFENKKEKIYRDIIRLAKRHFPINTARTIYTDPASNGLIINQADGSFEDKMSRGDVPYSLCSETPGKHPLQSRIALNLEIMTEIIKFTNKANVR